MNYYNKLLSNETKTPNQENYTSQLCIFYMITYQKEVFSLPVSSIETTFKYHNYKN